MYEFILNMFIAGKINESKVRSYCPLFITEEERDAVLEVSNG